MATVIYFAGGDLRVAVDEDPDQVAAAFASASGVGPRLTAHGGEGDIYINAATVAFWSGLGADPEPGPEPPKSIRQREPITNIWGQPIRREPRR